MTRVHVAASKEYDVLIESRLLDSVGETAAAAGAKKALVVSGKNVYPLYGGRVTASLERAGIEVKSLVLEPGERSKCFKNYEKLLNMLSRAHFDRSDAVIALGGGVTGDLAGFAAATYQRGMELIQLPTTLLAAVDSSVGGKTAIDLPTGKNQVGCFYQPRAVLCDPDTLKTLPEAQYRCGCAEVIKYAVLFDADFFRSLAATPVCDQAESVIKTCVEMKSGIVARDEFDTGCRQLLNLGHTVGHAVEACSGFTVLHGQAVAAGMAVIARAAHEKGICSADTLSALLDILAMYGLPDAVEYPADKIYRAILSDKKLRGGSISLVVPEEIGRCRIEKVGAEDITDWLRAGGLE